MCLCGLVFLWGRRRGNQIFLLYFSFACRGHTGTVYCVCVIDTLTPSSRIAKVVVVRRRRRLFCWNSCWLVVTRNPPTCSKPFDADWSRQIIKGKYTQTIHTQTIHTQVYSSRRCSCPLGRLKFAGFNIFSFIFINPTDHRIFTP